MTCRRTPIKLKYAPVTCQTFSGDTLEHGSMISLHSHMMPHDIIRKDYKKAYEKGNVCPITKILATSSLLTVRTTLLAKKTVASHQ